MRARCSATNRGGLRCAKAARHDELTCTWHAARAASYELPAGLVATVHGPCPTDRSHLAGMAVDASFRQVVGLPEACYFVTANGGLSVWVADPPEVIASRSIGPYIVEVASKSDD